MNWTALKKQIEAIASGGEGDPIVTSVVYDSRCVKPGAVYVAIPGTRIHGDSFIASAIANGAVAIVSENPHSRMKTPWIQVESCRRALGLIARCFWNIDPASITAVTVTGTNGKTTTAHLFATLLNQRFEPDQIWLYSTIGNTVEGKFEEAKNTTPETADIFARMAAAKQRPLALVMEASSHALALDRMSGLVFDIAVWTNLTQDHLDFHKDMETYYTAKKLLFLNYLKTNGWAVINIDDAYGRRLAGELASKNLITYGNSITADVHIENFECTWEKTTITLKYKNKQRTFCSGLAGVFNVSNMTAMAASAFALNFSDEQIALAFKQVRIVTGRMDRVALDAPFTVVVDYAHTPDALQNVLKTARALTKGQLLCVFGCGGDRDRGKRPLMATAVAAHCDEAIITSDNPRSENPQAIIKDILEGIPLDFPCLIEADRREAIKRALWQAKSGDTIVVAGKGHEEYQEIAGVKHHFNDRETIVELFSELKSEVNNG